jgi:hypothetical protein
METSEKQNLGNYIDFYNDPFDTEISIDKLFIKLYNEIGFNFQAYLNLKVKNFIQIITEKFELTSKSYFFKHETAKNSKTFEINHLSSEYLLELKPKVLLYISQQRLVIVYGNEIPFAEIKEIMQLAKTYKKKKHNRKFYMISASKHAEYGLDLQKFSIKKTTVDVNENYNDDFEDVNKTISDFLNTKDKNGLILLHGKYGTGKTTYIRHLISSINKRFIFLPLNLMEAISEPNFLPFISNYKESVLILEDAEDLLISRNAMPTRNNALVNLLNIGDGLLSDAFSIKIICTFNADLKQIDKAILRKGRLITRYEFKELSIEKTNNLRKKLNILDTSEQNMTLADIYNKDGVNFAELVEHKVGFKK